MSSTPGSIRRGNPLETGHRLLLKLTGGRFPRTVMGMLTVELHTVGRKSGRPFANMLTSPVHDDHRIVLVASKGGDPKDPDWYRNAIANPDVTLTVNGVDRLMTARTATPAERAELWPQVVKAYRGYAGYQEKTDREIPLLICEPRA
ncbi:MAG: nitroreductase/quinone reductase family protein [Mycolicibacterium insubricum]|nr:nitroreductase family deazaflavin-dependent oxidoreductase [Mycobacterium sp.]